MEADQSALSRRHALQGLAALGVATTLAPRAVANAPRQVPGDSLVTPLDVKNWDSVRAQFAIDRSWIHMSGLLFASHPRPVRDEIQALRARFDANPTMTIHELMPKAENEARQAVADYFGVAAPDVALTDSTTMGLGLLYGGLRLSPGDEVVTSEHDHFSTHESLRLACERSGAQLIKVRLFERSSAFQLDTAAKALAAALTPRTRAVALTWVHSATGLKLPVADLAPVIAAANQGRDLASRILYCIDGVHGTGVENVRLPELGCDFFAAGTHKWLFGPRGTGMLWGRPEVQSRIAPLFPSFSSWHGDPTWGKMMTPGGFHTYEHRWAVGAATRLHLAIGKARVQERIHALGTQMKEGLAGIKGLTLHTPMDPALSAGIVCFEIAGMTPQAVVAALAKRSIIASNTPYAVTYARVTPSLLNTPDDVTQTIKAIAEVSRGAATSTL